MYYIRPGVNFFFAFYNSYTLAVQADTRHAYDFKAPAVTTSTRLDKVPLGWSGKAHNTRQLTILAIRWGRLPPG